MGWVWHQVWHRVWHTNPPAGGGSLPSVCIPAGSSPARARAGRSATPSGPIRDALLRAFPGHRRHQRRVRLDVAGRVPQGRPRWPCSSATTRRTCTRRSLPGTTSRGRGPCSSSANFSSARRGSGSPGWASVSGSGPAFPRGHFRLRRTARRSSSWKFITRSEPSRAQPPNG